MEKTPDAASPIDIPVMPCHCLRCDTEAWKAIPNKTRMQQLLTPDATRMYVCAVCGCKRCPHSDDHRNACTDSNEPGQPGSRYQARNNEEFYKQAERIAEMETDLAEEAHIRDRMAQLLAETAVALKGPEKALHRHGWQDLPEVAAKQSAALKLAREALFDMQDSYAAVHGWKDSFVIAATTALAAIDALGEVK